MKSWNAGSTFKKRACATASMTGGDAFSLFRQMREALRHLGQRRGGGL